jgi:hypothetical protein
MVKQTIHTQGYGDHKTIKITLRCKETFQKVESDWISHNLKAEALNQLKYQLQEQIIQSKACFKRKYEFDF